MTTIQQINSELLNLMASRYLQLKDPARTIISTANVSNPPTDAELDSAFDTPANLPTGFIGLVDDNGAGTTLWVVVADGSNWWYVGLTVAV